MAVHRIIEAQAARYGDLPAISDQRITLSYRELNQRANVVARQLMAHGFKRGALATVCLPRSAETAIVLLGILKAGGTYALIDPQLDGGRWPLGVSFADETDDDEQRYRCVDITPALRQPMLSAANLPVVARDTDVACVIPHRDGSAPLLVPHATIMSLQHHAMPAVAQWSGEAGALDLWVALMNGATVTLTGSELRSAA